MFLMLPKKANRATLIARDATTVAKPRVVSANVGEAFAVWVVLPC